MDFFALEKGEREEKKRAHVPQEGVVLKRHLPSAWGCSQLPGGLGPRAPGGAAAPTGAGWATPAISVCARAREFAHGEGRAPSAHTDGPLGNGTKRVRASQGTWSSVRAGAGMARPAPGASASRAVVRGPPSIPGRGASVHTREFFKNNIFLDRPPAPTPHLCKAPGRAEEEAGLQS